MSRTLLRLWRSGSRLFAGPAASVAPVRRRRKAPRPRDFQRARVYRWEAEHVFPHAGERLSLDQCRTLVEEAYRWRERPGPDPSWKPPLVTDGRGRRHACGSREVIKLPRWSRTRAIVLHECAHGMADDQHGPKFVGTYVALLVEFAAMTYDELRAGLASTGIKIDSPTGGGCTCHRREN